MSQMKNGQNSEVLSLDYAYILRKVIKNIFMIIMVTCVIGTFSYILLDNFMRDSYTANVNLAVVSRDDSSQRMSEYNMSRAITRNLNVLNSDVLTERISKKEKADSIDGSISAQQVGESNVITLSATAGSADQAFRLLRMALNTYPELTEYFQSGYRLKSLNTLSTDNIIKNGAGVEKYTLLAAFLAFFAGVGIVAAYCMFTDKLHSEEQAQALLDIDVLGSVHFVKKKASQKAILITMQEPALSYFEDIDKLTTRLLSKKAHDCQTLMITSIHENEGKSTIASNLALSLARRGKKVLLVDADMRCPAVAKIFDMEIPDGRELSDFLERRASVDEVLTSLDQIKNLKFLCQKNKVAEPDKILNGELFSEEIREKLRKLADYVIIDTPPVGAVRDAELVARWVNGALLIVRQDEQSAAAVNDVVDVLEDAGTTVIGAVLNMAKGRGTSSKGKYYNIYGSKSRERR